MIALLNPNPVVDRGERRAIAVARYHERRRDAPSARVAPRRANVVNGGVAIDALDPPRIQIATFHRIRTFRATEDEKDEAEAFFGEVLARIRDRLGSL